MFLHFNKFCFAQLSLLKGGAAAHLERVFWGIGQGRSNNSNNNNNNNSSSNNNNNKDNYIIKNDVSKDIIVVISRRT